ncbi:MAG: LCP family protein [Acidimicrobiales bacterium]
MPAHRARGAAPLDGPRRWPRRTLIVVNVLVALALLGAGGAYAYVTYQFDQIRQLTLGALVKPGASPSGAPFTMLVVGSDSRALAANPDNAQFGTKAQTAGQRSDTTMLVRVVPATRQLTILSVPRDLWVPIAGMGTQRINAAFDKGPDLLISTIQAQLGIPVNHYVEVNFDSFRQITDAVGGVKFYFPTPAKDNYSLLNVRQPGCVNLTGDQALGFVRSRHYEYYQNGQWHFEPESDLARIQRQQAFVKKMIAKAQTEYTNPVAINGIIGGITSNLTVDSGFGRNLMLSLAKDFRSLSPTGIATETLPTFNKLIGGAQVLGVQEPQAQQMIDAFNATGTTPRPTATTTPTNTSALPRVAPSSVSIEVVNGSGVAGQAAQAVKDLAAAGYRAGVNATTRAYVTGTEIRYAPDALGAATQLQAQVGGGATLVPDPSLAPTAYNLELITGKSYTGVGGAGVGGATSSAGGSSASAVSPSTARGTTTTLAPAGTPATPAPYVLPGTPTGQLPPPDC